MDYKQLVEQLKRKGLSNGSSLGHHSGLYDEAATAITELLDRAESAEKKLAECEPKHGHWETVRNKVLEHGEVIVNGTAEWCSVCKHADKDFKKWFKLCPNCGAIMDEKQGMEE